MSIGPPHKGGGLGCDQAKAPSPCGGEGRGEVDTEKNDPKQVPQFVEGSGVRRDHLGI